MYSRKCLHLLLSFQIVQGFPSWPTCYRPSAHTHNKIGITCRQLSSFRLSSVTECQDHILFSNICPGQGQQVLSFPACCQLGLVICLTPNSLPVSSNIFPCHGPQALVLMHRSSTCTAKSLPCPYVLIF